MKFKIVHFLLILFSLIGYLEWGQNNHAFLFQIETELLSKFTREASSLLHPLILIPMIGQSLLIFALIKKNPSKKWIYAGITCITILMTFIFVIGILSSNLKIACSALPFLLLAVIAIRLLYQH